MLQVASNHPQENTKVEIYEPLELPLQTRNELTAIMMEMKIEERLMDELFAIKTQMNIDKAAEIAKNQSVSAAA